MNARSSLDFDECVRAFERLDGHVVWSLIVTVFGDLARNDGDVISGPVLHQILAQIHIRPEAIRVALHRLRKDSWLISTKAGRTSNHSLSSKGREESRLASQRIYAAEQGAERHWHMLLSDPGRADTVEAELRARGYARLMPHCFVRSGKAHAPPEGLFEIEGQARAAPTWLRERLVSAEARAHHAALLAALECLADDLAGLRQLTPVRRAALRTLIVHHWRRIVLRSADLPVAFLPEDWPGGQCRRAVLRLLEALPRPTLADLERGIVLVA